jgi:cytochrome c oxidase subunit II
MNTLERDPTPRARRRAVPAAAAVVACVLLASCATARTPSALDPHGPGADRIAGLWWFMFGVSAFVVALVTALLLFGVRAHRRRRAVEPSTATPRWAKGMVVVGGVAFPIVVLTVLWVLTLNDMAALSFPGPDAGATGTTTTGGALEIRVVGYQWWWRVVYPGGVSTANDVHIPTGQPVRLLLQTHDVNHSFWVPQLTGKTDLIAGKVNRTWVQADRPGIYRGQCAEYCGLQHANMAFYVVAQSPADFRAWLARERRPVAAPATSGLLHGQSVFLSQPCGACHTVRGTPAHGTVGPDLTHFGSRISIGAGTVPNTPGYLGGWIVDSQGLKPGNRMPPIQLQAQDLQDLVDYLESLK